MAKAKQPKFAENLTFAHVLQPAFAEVMEDRFAMKGHWNRDFFKRDAPLVVELGCGKGEYSTGLAALQPHCNYVGVDIKGARIWRGARTVKEQGLTNVGFLRTHVDQITSCFAPGEVSAIWLTFSDPQISKARKRLTAPMFLERYRRILVPDGVVNLKTDSPLLYEYTLEQITEQQLPLLESSADVYGELVPRLTPDMQAVLNIRTHYERLWLAEGRKIHYCRFKVNKG